MAENAKLETIGTPKVTTWGIFGFLASALLTGACTWYQFGPAFGVVIGLAGFASAIGWYARRGQACFTIEHQCLVQHLGRFRKRYAWAGMRRPVRLQHRLFQHFIEVRREKGVPWLIAVDDLNEEERQRLLAIVTEIVCSRRRHESSPSKPAESRSEGVATTST